MAIDTGQIVKKSERKKCCINRRYRAITEGLTERSLAASCFQTNRMNLALNFVYFICLSIKLSVRNSNSQIN